MRKNQSPGAAGTARGAVAGTARRGAAPYSTQPARQNKSTLWGGPPWASPRPLSLTVRRIANAGGVLLWRVDIADHSVTVTTATLQKFRRLQRLVFSEHGLELAPVRQADWFDVLRVAVAEMHEGRS